MKKVLRHIRYATMTLSLLSLSLGGYAATPIDENPFQLFSQNIGQSVSPLIKSIKKTSPRTNITQLIESLVADEVTTITRAASWSFVALQIRFSGFLLKNLVSTVSELLSNQLKADVDQISPYALTGQVFGQMNAGLYPPLETLVTAKNLTALDKTYITKNRIMNLSDILVDMADMHQNSNYYNSYGAFCNNYNQKHQVAGVKKSKPNPDNLICRLTAKGSIDFMNARTLLDNRTLASETQQLEAKTLIGLIGYADPYQFFEDSDWQHFHTNSKATPLLRNDAFIVYRAQMRQYVANKSMGLGALYYILARHMPIPTAGALLQNVPNFLSRMPKAASMDEINHLLAHYRFMQPEAGHPTWLNSLVSATPSRMLREIAYELNDIQLLLETKRQIEQRYIAVNAATEEMLASFLQGNLQEKRKKIITKMLTPAEQAAAQKASANAGYSSYAADAEKAQEAQSAYDSSPCSEKHNNPNESASAIAAQNKQRADSCKSYAKGKAESYCNPLKHGFGRASHCLSMKHQAEDKYHSQQQKESTSSINSQASGK